MTMRSLRDLISDAIAAGKALCATILRFEPFTAVSLAVQSTGSPWGQGEADGKQYHNGRIHYVA
jgi:hypothetical protein